MALLLFMYNRSNSFNSFSVISAAGPAGEIHCGALQLHLQQHLQVAVVAHAAERGLYRGAGHALCGRHAVPVAVGAGQGLHPRSGGGPRNGALGDAAAAKCRAHGTVFVPAPVARKPGASRFRRICAAGMRKSDGCLESLAQASQSK